MNAWWQLARVGGWTILASESFDPAVLSNPTILGQVSPNSKPPWLCLWAYNIVSDTGWSCVVYSAHFGSEKIVCEILEERSALVTFFGDTLFVLDLKDGVVLRCIDLSSELYVQDVLWIVSSELLLVSTAQSLHCFNQEFKEIWSIDNIGVDGVSFCVVKDTNVLILGQDPGNAPTKLLVRLENGQVITDV